LSISINKISEAIASPKIAELGNQKRVVSGDESHSVMGKSHISMVLLQYLGNDTGYQVPMYAGSRVASFSLHLPNQKWLITTLVIIIPTDANHPSTD